MFTITNLLAGAISFGGVGTVPVGGTLTSRFITKEMRAAVRASQISITPAVTTTPATSAITNSISSYAVTSIVDPEDVATARANDATLASEVIKIRNDLEALRAFVEEWVKPGTN